MLCPNPSCAAITPHPTLTLSERQGIEIDYCPTCRGVWLDRGELDKLIERSATMAPAPAYKHSHKEHYNKDYYKGHYGHRKKSLLGELFDF